MVTMTQLCKPKSHITTNKQSKSHIIDVVSMEMNHPVMVRVIITAGRNENGFTKYVNVKISL